MTDEKLRRRFKNIRTEKFKPIKNALGLSGLASLFLTIIATNPIVDYSFYVLFLINYSSYLTMKNYRALDFTKGYIDLEEEHNLFLKNYKDLMASLDFNTIAHLCSSFYYLYKNGYLSVSGEFSSSSKDYFEGRRFQLVNIFNGCGVCRHKANSLKDILNYCGYPSASIPIYARTYEKYTGEDLENMKKYLLTLFDEILEEDGLKTFAAEAFLNMEVLLHQIELDSQMESEGYSEEKRQSAVNNGNHLSVITTDKSDSIVYDPTDNCFYQFKDKNSCDIINMYGFRYEYRLNCIEQANTPSEQKIFMRNLKLNPMSLEGLYEAQKEAEKRITDNLDMVDKFRKDNLSLMQSLRDKAYRLENN